MENALRVNHKLSNTYTQSNQPLNNNTTPRKSIISTSLSKNRDSVISR